MGSRAALAQVKDGNFATVVDVSVDLTTVYTGQGFIVGIYVNTAIATAAVNINDDTDTKFIIPVGIAAGTWIPLGDAEFLTSLVVDPGDSATGSITVVWSAYSSQ